MTESILQFSRILGLGRATQNSEKKILDIYAIVDPFNFLFFFKKTIFSYYAGMFISDTLQITTV